MSATIVRKVTSMASSVTQVKIRVGPQGRVVIPAPLREQLSIAEGDEIIAWLDGRRLALEKVEEIKARLQAQFAGLDVSLADELIAQRRADARREK